MAHIGIGYTGTNETFLRDLADFHSSWLSGDRIPRFFGNRFVVLYDSNTAQEFVKKCKDAAGSGNLIIYSMNRMEPHG